MKIDPDKRNTYIGSSDASDILAGNFDRLWREKMGIVERPDLDDSFPVQLGRLTEDFHLDWTIKRLSEERGYDFTWSKAQKNGKQHFAWQTFSNPDPSKRSFQIPLGSHPDAIVKSDHGNALPMEVKITGRFRNADEAAQFYMPQIQHHLICWSADTLLFSVVCGTSEPERIWVGHSPEWQDHYIEQCAKFWHYIEAETAPAPMLFGDASPTMPKIPAKIADSVPLNGFKRRSLADSNQAPALIEEFLITKKQAARHDEVKKELKEMMREDENELYHDALVIKRSKSNSILFQIKDEGWTQAKEAAE